MYLVSTQAQLELYCTIFRNITFKILISLCMALVDTDRPSLAIEIVIKIVINNQTEYK